MYFFNNLQNSKKYNVLNSHEMAFVESQAIKKGISEEYLMEAAGLKVALVIKNNWKKSRIIILSGPGNNGGDGFVAARILHQLGWPVRVILLGKIQKIKGVAAKSLSKWLDVGGKLYSLDKETIQWGDLFIDALFGSGLSRGLNKKILELFDCINNLNLPCVAIDIPSGVNCNTGEIMGGSLKCDITITFFRPKIGHFILPGKGYCGKVIVEDIGIPDNILNDLNNKTYINSPLSFSKIKNKYSDHKYQRGHLVVFGGYEMSGASKLVALAGRRVGAGLVTIVAPEESRLIYTSSEPGNIFKSLKSFDSFSFFEKELIKIKPDTIVIGPGFGNNNCLIKILNKLSSMEIKIKSIVLDADALTCFEGKLEEFIKLLSELSSNVILTPHEGEFFRIFGASYKKLSKPQAALKASILTNSIVILKGSDTIIATPSSQIFISYNGPPNLATAGSGDVLSGIIGGFLAQDMKAVDAACIAVWVHSRTGCIIGKDLIAEDIISNLSNVIHEDELKVVDYV